jgi:antirestriction protein ArdC
MTDKISVYEIVTNQIVKLLDAGTVPWRKPWAAAGMPRNLTSGKPYRGVNVFLLATAAMEAGYSSPYWMSYKQAQEHGGNVKKGEKSTIVIFWKKLISKELDEDGKPKIFFMARYYRVFNLEQTEGVKIPKGRAIDQPREIKDPIAEAEAIIASYPNAPEMIDGGAVAVYDWATDVITSPKMDDHFTAEEYYSTKFHEMGHSTGHKSRLKRPIENAFGSHAYGREELVAEMTAAFLLAEAGINAPTIENNAAYLASWIRTIKEDTQAVIKAASQAQRAADHILGRTFEDQQEETEMEKAA